MNNSLQSKSHKTGHTSKPAICLVPVLAGLEKFTCNTMSHVDFSSFQDGHRILKIAAKAETLFHLIWDFRCKMVYFC
jgi:hypothetical protein